MTIKEQVFQELDSLSEAELKKIAEYLAFLKFKARIKPIQALNKTQLAALYAGFAEEDRKLAEEGFSDYVEALAKEDAR